MRPGILLIALTCLFLSGCSSRSALPEEKPGGDYITHAELLEITKHPDYTQVAIRQPGATPEIYILIHRDSVMPENLPAGTIIRTPVRNSVVYSSVHASALKELGSIDCVRGVTDAQYFKIPEIVKGLETGTIANIGASANPSTEKLLAIHPDAVMISIYKGMVIGNLGTLDLPIIGFLDQLEPTPLGRAEWIKFLGALTGKEEIADSIFASVESRYNTIASNMKNADNKPRVLTDNMYQGVWYVPGGNSYQAKLIADAGGRYVFADDKSTGSLALSYEQILAKGVNADIWLLKVYDTDVTRKSLASEDSRYTVLKPYKSGNVYWTDTSKSTLYEDFPFHPEMLLADYAAIFHPEDFSWDLRYFKKMQ